MNVYPWQLDMLDKMIRYKGKGFIQVTGRQVGKSTYSQEALKRLFDEIYAQPVSEIKTSQGTVYGSRYYCVEPVGGSWYEMESWCYEKFGKSGDSMWGEKKAPKPAERWYMNSRKFWFRDEADQMMFVLRWR